MLKKTTSLIMFQGGYEVNKSKAELGEGKMNHLGLVKHSKLPK